MVDLSIGARFEAGRVLKHAMTIFKHDALAIALLSVLFIAVPDALVTYAPVLLADERISAAARNTWVIIIVNPMIAMLGSTLLQATISSRALMGMDGRDRPSGDRFFGSFQDYLAVIALGLVTTLGIMGGFVLLVIPGIILSLAWMVAVPAMVTERLGVMDAIRRSNKLTGERRGEIFGLCVAAGLIGLLLSWLATLAFSAVGNSLVTTIGGSVTQTLTSAANALLAVAIYYELRWSKEGTPAESLAAVFA
ncbi:MAG: hypothetical protein J7515_01055 [Caulobacter sp.]|nr:hypothetical protein [Caulobacter sp.]